MDACRAINELVFAVLFVVAVGLGPFAGVMALFIHNTGILAKLFSEAVEAFDPRPVEGIRATGASVQEIIYGVIPQVMPLWLSYGLYRFESNVRGATVLGIVGAGGIGQCCSKYPRLLLCRDRRDHDRRGRHRRHHRHDLATAAKDAGMSARYAVYYAPAADTLFHRWARPGSVATPWSAKRGSARDRDLVVSRRATPLRLSRDAQGTFHAVP